MAVTIPIKADLKLRFTGTRDGTDMRRLVEGTIAVGDAKIDVSLSKDTANTHNLGDLNVAMPMAVRAAIGDLAVPIALAITADDKFMGSLVGLAEKQAGKSPTARGERI